MSDANEQDVQARIAEFISNDSRYSFLLENCKVAWARLAGIKLFREMARAAKIEVVVQPAKNGTDTVLQSYVLHQRDSIVTALKLVFGDKEAETFMQAEQQKTEAETRQQLVKAAVEQRENRPVVGRYSAAHLAEDTPGSEYFMGRSRV